MSEHPNPEPTQEVENALLALASQQNGGAKRKSKAVKKASKKSSKRSSRK